MSTLDKEHFTYTVRILKKVEDWKLVAINCAANVSILWILISCTSFPLLPALQ